MANPNNTGTHKTKETYAKQVLEIARLETNIYDDFSTDYEKDEVTGKIMVPTRNNDVKVTEYDIKNGIELSQSSTDYIELPVDKDYAINELIDGYEAEAVPDNIRAQRIESAGFSVGYKKESFAVDALVKEGTPSPEADDVTAANVYNQIIREIKNMKKRGMKPSMMRVAVSADIEEMLLTDEKFSNTSGTLGAELVREGVIGKIGGVATKPNYLMGDDILFIVYDKRFCQRYEIWKKAPAIEDLKDGKHVGASALQGRLVGGLKVTNALGVQVRKKKTSVDPEITSVSVSMTKASAKQSEAVADTEIASVSVEGGTQPYSYELTGTDADKFKIEETKIKIKEQSLTENTYKASVKVTDSKSKTKTSSEFTFTVTADGD